MQLMHMHCDALLFLLNEYSWGVHISIWVYFLLNTKWVKLNWVQHPFPLPLLAFPGQHPNNRPPSMLPRNYRLMSSLSLRRLYMKYFSIFVGESRAHMTQTWIMKPLV